MRDRLSTLLGQADMAIASCSGVIAAERLAGSIASVEAMRIRLSSPEDVLVVALAGGTGSGKSSLFNALVGEEVADVGGVRPTTSQAEAAVPAGRETAMATYLDLLGITERHPYQGVICLLDLPDFDSLTTEHRHHVDSLLPLVDLVVWVIDPEKYRDARLHHEYLAPLAGYADQFLFALNQIDRVGPDAAGALMADLRAALADDGLGDPWILAMSAAPVAGPPIGADELRAELESRASGGDTLHTKLLTDLVAIARRLEQDIGPPVDFDQPAGETVATATARIVDDDVEGATSELTRFLDRVAVAAGGETRLKIERLTGDVPQHVQRIAAETRPEEIRRWLRRPVVATRDPDRVRPLLEEAVSRPVRALLAKRAVALASIAELAIEAEGLGDAARR